MGTIESFIYPVLIFGLAALIYWYIKKQESKEGGKKAVDSSDESRHEEAAAPQPTSSTESEVQDDIESSKNSYDSVKPNNKDLLVKTLMELGCKPEISDDDQILFKFQGENFSVAMNNNFLRIWDLPFGNVNVLDTNLPLIIEGINAANFGMGPTIVLGEPNEKGERYIASRMDLIFFSHIPEPEKYLESILHLFFDAKFNLKREFDKQISSSNNSDASVLTSASPFQN